MLKIGSHCGMNAPNYLLGSVEEALSYGANALMVYTGAPQNTRRQALDKCNIEAAHALMLEHNLDQHDLIIHAPYLINLANTKKADTFDLGVDLLKSEIERSIAFGAKYMVLHPGAHVGAGSELGIESIVKGLDLVNADNDQLVIALETMAGKGTEVGRTFEEIAQIISKVQKPEMLGVTLDTCHINDAGYDLSDLDQVLADFDQIIGLDKLSVIHLNDSLNPIGSHKDRHANIGEGTIGFDNLARIVHDPRLAHVVKILETPYIDGNPPYDEEIKALRNAELSKK
ncbi:MAG: deoxyribonuclease IV [Erysipelothrix sp.]|nr:deoxyribonuclease IV [Erysipelothrix sp.]